MFVLGLGSAFHCMVMCGPLSQVALGNQAKSVEKLLVYHGFRILAYLLLAYLSSIFGIIVFKALGINHHQKALTWASAIVLMVLALIPFLRKKTEKWGYGALKPILNSLMHQHLNIRKQSPNLALGIMGFMHGLIPCGLVYGALFLAISAGSLLEAIGSMLYFGLATSAVLILGNTIVAFIPRKIKFFNSQWLMAAVSLVLVWRLVYHSHLPENAKPHSPGASIECRK